MKRIQIAFSNLKIKLLCRLMMRSNSADQRQGYANLITHELNKH